MVQWDTLQRRPESYKAGIISWWKLLDPLGVATLTPWDHLRWLCYSVAEYCCRCPTAFFHAPHLWHRLVNSITMVARSHKYWTTNSATQSCHRQVDNAGWMSPCLAIIWWRLSPSSTSPEIARTTVEGHAVNWCHKSVEGRLAIGYGGHFSGRPHNPTSRFWS